MRLEVGTAGRPHGLRGEILVSFTTDRVAERTEPGAELWAGDRRLVVVHAQPHQDRWLVAFQGIGTREQAAELTNQVLVADPIDDPEALWVHELVGGVVVEERSGVERGAVVAVLENPANDLLELATGALVPTVFVVRVERDGDHGHRVVIDPPDGLFD